MHPRLALVLLLGWGTNALADDPQRNPDAIEGAWVAVTLTADGKEAKVQGNQFFFAKGKLTIKRPTDQEKLEGTYQLGEGAKAPKPIQVTLQGSKMQGIYELDGERLRICLAAAGKQRPSEFKDTEQTTLIVLKRQRP